MSDSSLRQNKNQGKTRRILAVGLIGGLISAVLPVSSAPQAVAVSSETLSGAIAQMDANLGSLNQQASSLGSESAAVSHTVASLKAQYDALVPVLKEKRANLREAIREAYMAGDPSTLEVIASNNTFSGVIGQQQYRDQISEQTKEAADEVAATQAKIDAKLKAAQEKQASLASLQAQIQGRIATAQAQISAKEALLQATQGQEARYQELRSQQQADDLAAVAGGSPSPSSSPGNGGYQQVHGNNPYPYGQCTWYVYDRTGRGQNGNAGSWYASHSSPHPGDIMIWRPGQMGASSYGHVAVVESVNSDGTVNVSHMNWGGGPGVVSYGTFASTGNFW